MRFEESRWHDAECERPPWSHWRLYSGMKGAWRGPAIVVGHQGEENTWVSNGGEAVLVAREQLREAVEEECWAPGLDEKDLHETLIDLVEKLDRDEPQGVDERGPGPAPEDAVEPPRDVDGLWDFSKKMRTRTGMRGGQSIVGPWTCNH